MNDSTFSTHYENEDAIQKLKDYLLSVMTYKYVEYIICCIGTDRSTGDCLGPLVGSHLSQMPHFPVPVIGTLQYPLHALNLQQRISQLNETYSNTCIIAIDASLSDAQFVGQIIAQKGSIQPGQALQKKLPPIGDIAIKGVVNIGGFMENAVLQSTRLHITYSMSNIIAQALYEVFQSNLLKDEHNSNNTSYDNKTRQQIRDSNFC